MSVPGHVNRGGGKGRYACLVVECPVPGGHAGGEGCNECVLLWVHNLLHIILQQHASHSLMSAFKSWSQCCILQYSRQCIGVLFRVRVGCPVVPVQTEKVRLFMTILWVSRRQNHENTEALVGALFCTCLTPVLAKASSSGQLPRCDSSAVALTVQAVTALEQILQTRARMRVEGAPSRA